MVSSRALSSNFLELNPQTLTQVSLHAWMDHEVCHNSILSCFL
jgi:predicted SprT family Zn-dependent metalloprotease